MSDTMASKGKSARLGKGLTALMGDYAPPPSGGEPAPSSEPAIPATEIAIDLVTPNPKQPRRTFAEADLEELSSSIKAKGVLQAILVRPDPKAADRYQIVAGERRWRAAKRAGLNSIPAVVRPFDELEVLEIGIIENVQRADLNPVEEAEAYQQLIDRFGRTQDALAEQVGKSRAHIANTLRLLKLPEDVREHMRLGRLTAGHARAALAAPDPSRMAEEIIVKGLSVREAERLAQKLQSGGELDAVGKAVRSGVDKDVDTEALEGDLAHALGLDVDIRHKGVKGGEVRIKYRDLEQLDEVCRRLSSGRPGGEGS
ncbi:MAG: ParB/RepB/Spo0J family partition protein [Pseudomonadota bacterium]